MKNETVLITGASSGIGQALAEEHARLGSNLILIARREQELKKVKERCLALDPSLKIKLLVADVSQTSLVELLKKELLDINNLQAVYANAGVGAAGLFEKLELEDFRRVFDINVMGVLHTLYGCLDALKKSKGRIVLIASLNSYFALPLGSPYNMSKFAIRALGESLWAELANSGIGVSTVYPGPVKTEILTINNKGHLSPEARAFFADRKSLSATTAARRIISKSKKGKRAFSLTAGTSFLIWFQQRCPGTTAHLIRFVFGKFKNRILTIVGKANPNAV